MNHGTDIDKNSSNGNNKFVMKYTHIHKHVHPSRNNYIMTCK